MVVVVCIYYLDAKQYSIPSTGTKKKYNDIDSHDEARTWEELVEEFGIKKHVRQTSQPWRYQEQSY